MAGIGFTLRRLSARDTYAGHLQAYAYSGLISCGPWIISIFSIVALTMLFYGRIEDAEMRLFSSTITHVYALSLILVGPLQLVLTRFVADQFSAKTPEKIFPSAIGALGLTGLLAALAGGVFFFGFVPGSLLYQASAAALMVCVAAIFIIANYLNAVREYGTVVLAFFIGYGASVAAAFGGALSLGAEGAVLGFTLGHMVLLLLLIYALHREFGGRVARRSGVAAHFRRFPGLMLCGLLYSLGIWIDKFLFWHLSHQNIEVSGALHAAPEYDMAIYLSLLSIAPGLAVFVLRLETDFAERYEAFFTAIREGGSLAQIREARDAIADSLRSGFSLLFRVQGLTTVLLAIFAYILPNLVTIGAVQLGIFRVTLFGAFLLVIFLSLLTVLFYFDDRGGALLCSGAFLFANASFSIATVWQNEAWYGFGFVIASALAALIAGARVNKRLRHLEYHIFAGAR
ncbi:MAG: exopolysaccharide Pel transporter PelG [Verrucomicrobiales bacterium]